MRNKCLVLFLSFVLIAVTADAQLGILRTYNRYQRSSGAGRRMWQRYYLGGGICMMSINLEQHYYDGFYDKTVKMKISSSNSYSYTEGVYFPFMKPKKDASFGLDVATTVNMFNYNVGTIVYTPESSVTETGIVAQALLPISLVYKSGGEAILNKRSKFLFTAGIGIAPSYSISKVVSADLQFSARKFIMVEMGYFAGIAFKLRANVFFGSVNLVSVEGDDFSNVSHYSGNIFGTVDTKVTGNTGVTLTLSLMPFSWDWKKKNAWGDDE